MLARSGVEHDDILAAILEGNPPKAAELMRQHIHQLVDDFSGAASAE
ncbi:FCD domain-containing protein [Agrobacterium sp.]|nr:FCD domain-containing protein [Agrobacterium sp.]